MKTSIVTLLAIAGISLISKTATAQVNSGSDGHDGALTPANNLVIDMADHPDGIYNYTTVNIPAGVKVSFVPNAGNKPVVWLVQGICQIDGVVDISGKDAVGSIAGTGGPGGWRGGNGGTNPTAGEGLGGSAKSGQDGVPGGGSFGSLGQRGFQNGQGLPGMIYGNSFLLPLVGGSGAGGEGQSTGGGGGGGGALLIAASTSITLNGQIVGNGGYGYSAGSGGAVRFVSAILNGSGSVRAAGGTGINSPLGGGGGLGRVRFDTFQNNFGGQITGVFTVGFQPIILPASGQGIQLGIASIAGVAVAANPSGVLANPDVIIPAQQTNPVPVVVKCANVPLNTEITVAVHSANGNDVQVVGLNSAGTLASSTATISLNLPRGGGIIYAKAVTGIAGTALNTRSTLKKGSLAEYGWTADGESFAKMEIIAAIGGKQQITYITDSGRRHTLTTR